MSDAKQHDEYAYSNAGPAIAYSPVIRTPEDDPLLRRLVAEHGADPRRAADDLTATLPQPKRRP